MNAISIRRAVAADLPGIVRLLADDPLGAQREKAGTPLDGGYVAAFEAIDADPRQLLVVAELDDEVVGTLQLSFLPGLARIGAWRGQIEAVRISRSQRGKGLGEQLIRWAIEECRSRNCTLVQLTTDASRSDAHRFYERLGFVGSHIGYKLSLT
jgi:GNAT superfamily N-acetyltransferase